MSEVIKNRYEFSVLFDVENGNPNGDPDSENMPRIDQETHHGLVTDVCLKRKIRNYIDAAFGDKVENEGNEKEERRFKIYIKENVPLQIHNNEALEHFSFDPDGKVSSKDDPDIDNKIRDFMCRNFYDIRTFGAVMTTFTKLNLNCGQVCGPIQFGFAKSIDPIMPQEITITRLTGATDAQHTIGRKFIVPYALYRVDGYISANLAQKTTKFTESDLEKFWQALINMFEVDRAAARGKMAVRKLVVFKHDSILGNAPAHKLFDLIKVSKKDEETIPRSYQDYVVTVDKDACPNGVTITEMA